MNEPGPSFSSRPDVLAAPRSLVRSVRRREIGLHARLQQRAICQYELNTFPVRIYGRNKSTSRRTIKDMFIHGGVLGLSHDEKWLLGFNRVRRENAGDIYMMKLYAGYCTLSEIMRIPDFPERGLIFTYFPQASNHSATLLIDFDQWKLRKTSGPSSLEMSIHFFLPSFHLHVSCCSVVTFLQRCPDGKKALSKQYLRVHDSGGILNAGTTLINFNFTTTYPMCTKSSVAGRTIWTVTPHLSDEVENSQSSSVLTLDLGERIGVWPTLTHEVFAGIEYRLNEIPIDFTGELPGNSKLFVSRQCVDVEKVISSCMSWAFKKETALYQGMVDYEVEIVQVESAIAYLVIYCVSEFQVKRPDGCIQNEFYTAKLQLNWNLESGLLCRSANPVIIEKLTPQKAYNSRGWYPLSCFPVEACSEISPITNGPMITGQNEKILNAPGGAIRFVCETSK